MPWNSLRSWLKQSPTSPKHTSSRSRTVRLSLEPLEVRVTPTMTVGPNINVTKSAGNEQETSITVNPTNPQNLFATSTSGVNQFFSLDGGATWTPSDISSIGGGTKGGGDA